MPEIVVLPHPEIEPPPVLTPSWPLWMLIGGALALVALLVISGFSTLIAMTRTGIRTLWVPAESAIPAGPGGDALVRADAARLPVPRPGAGPYAGRRLPMRRRPP